MARHYMSEERLNLERNLVGGFLGCCGQEPELAGDALALAAGDRVWMLENAVYSVISPEGCASILWKDAAKAGEAAACLKLTAQDAKEFGLIEQIISEAGIGKKEYYDRIGALLTEELRALCMEPNLLELRYRRFRKIGAYETEEETR